MLAFAGNHRQFTDWLATQRGNANATRAREITREEQLRGVSAEDVEFIWFIGTYAQHNPAWRSAPYERLMGEGLALGKPWAIDEVEDLRRAYSKPVPPAQMAVTRRRLQELERQLSDE